MKLEGLINMNQLTVLALLLMSLLVGCSKGDLGGNDNIDDVLKAAKNDKPEAVFKLAYLYFKKNDFKLGSRALYYAKEKMENKQTSDKYLKAVNYVKDRAKTGDPTWLFILGSMHNLKIGMPTDDKETIRLYIEAAEKGEGNAQLLLGNNYESGLTVTADKQEALKWYLKGANAGHPEAQNTLAGTYFDGRLGVKDAKEGVKWLKMAADQNSSSAIGNLANKYYFGEGVVKDYHEAFKLLEKASQMGNAAAQYNLANMYENGTGVNKDIVMAYAWVNIAAASGQKSASNFRSDIERDMTKTQVEQGQKTSNELMEKYKLKIYKSEGIFSGEI